MKVEPEHGGTRIPFDPVLLPSHFQHKVRHPSFETWKKLSEKLDESWEEIQVSFLHEAEIFSSKKKLRHGHGLTYIVDVSKVNSTVVDKR